jgi:hypothetical protein
VSADRELTELMLGASELGLMFAASSLVARGKAAAR